MRNCYSTLFTPRPWLSATIETCTFQRYHRRCSGVQTVHPSMDYGPAQTSRLASPSARRRKDTKHGGDFHSLQAMSENRIWRSYQAAQPAPGSPPKTANLCNAAGVKMSRIARRTARSSIGHPTRTTVRGPTTSSGLSSTLMLMRCDGVSKL